MQQAAISTAPACHRKINTPDPLPRFAPHSESLGNGRYQLAFQVDGIHCARCIWAIESALAKADGITNARVNMSTSRLLIEWQGSAAQADDYAAIVQSLGYALTPANITPTAEPQDKFLLRCVAVAGFAMGNIMLLSVALWSSDQTLMGIATRSLFHWASAAIALPTIAYAGRPFFRSAYAALSHRRTNMDVPISLALILSCAMSLFETIHHGEHAYFDSAVMLLFFLLIGRWLDARARGKARENATSLLSMMQGTATLIEGTAARAIAIKDLREGMRLHIAAGEKIPTDAIIESGSSELDTSLVTGETTPHPVSAGDTIYGGTINLSAPLIAQVQKPSDQSLLADIVRLLEQAEQGRARYVRLADRAAKLYTPVVHTLAASAFAGWIILGGMAWQDALLIAVTTLIITCPCALALAVPVVQVLATGWLMKRGILVKSGDALERLAAIDSVAFDKTGTLTRGTPTLLTQPDHPDALQLAASLAVHSRHPLSLALCAANTQSLLPLTAPREETGCGIEARWQGKWLSIGRRSWCGDESAPIDPLQELWLEVEGSQPLRFTFSDPLRDDATAITQKLQAQSLTLHILSGDRADVVIDVANTLRIPHYRAACLPADKVRILEQLRTSGHRVLMVGDGLNDAPALAEASVSMSPASGMDITQNTADIVFQGSRLAPVAQALTMARFSTRLVKQNFALAIGYNCIAIPLAVAGYVTPLVAAIAMSSSSLLVILNAFRINRIKD